MGTIKNKKNHFLQFLTEQRSICRRWTKSGVPNEKIPPATPNRLPFTENCISHSKPFLGIWEHSSYSQIQQNNPKRVYLLIPAASKEIMKPFTHAIYKISYGLSHVCDLWSISNINVMSASMY